MKEDMQRASVTEEGNTRAPTKARRGGSAIDVTSLATGNLPPASSALTTKPEEVGSATSWRIVRRGELMFSSVSRENNAYWHMKTSDPAGRKCAARGRQKTTSRTWGPIGGERLKRDVYSVNFLTTKR
ncbi:hypothetical protein ACER0C_016491 [Sarotherodon galilaeus]